MSSSSSSTEIQSSDNDSRGEEESLHEDFQHVDEVVKVTKTSTEKTEHIKERKGKSSPKRQTKEKRRRYTLSWIRRGRKQRAEKSKDKITCPICSGTFININRHYADIHSNETYKAPATTSKGQKYPCPICTFEFVRVDKHLISGHKIKKESEDFKCFMDQFYEDKNKIRLEEEKSIIKKSKTDEKEQSHPPAKDKSTAESDDDTPSSDSSTSRKPLKRKKTHDVEMDDDDDDDNMPPLEESSTSSTSSNGESISAAAERLLDHFRKYLTSIDGGLKTTKIAGQHVSQIKMIWSKVSRSWRVADTVDTDRLKKKWLNLTLKEDKQKPGTVAAYLSSLSLWGRYLTQKGYPKAKILKDAIKGWRTSIHKKKKIRRVQHMLEQEEEIFTPEEIKALDECAASTFAETALSHLKQGKQVEMNAVKYNTVVAYLSLQLLINTGHRAGVVVNMTVMELEGAKVLGEGETAQRIITVKDHKTGYMGPAMIPVPEAFYNILRKALLKENNIKFDNKQPVFLMYEGSTFSSSQLMNYITRKYSDVIGKKINASILRKTVATRMWESHPEQRVDLARQMSHSVATAEKYYVLGESRQKSATIGASIRSVVRGQKEDEEGKEQEHAEEEGKTKEQETQPATEDKEHTQDEGEITQEEKDGSTKESEILWSEGEELRPLSPNLQRALKSTISAFKGKGPKKRKATDVTKTTQEQSTSAEQVIYALQSDETLSRVSFQSMPSTSSKGRRNFSPDDVAYLFEVCADNLKWGLPMTQSEMTNALDTEAGKELLQKYSLKQLVDRLRTEMRRRLQDK